MSSKLTVEKWKNFPTWNICFTPFLRPIRVNNDPQKIWLHFIKVELYPSQKRGVQLKLCLLRRLISFQRSTVDLSRPTGIKVTSCQSWRFEKNSAIRPTPNHARAARVRFPDGRITLQLWQLVTLQPVSLQSPTVPLWKDLNLLTKQNFNWED